MSQPTDEYICEQQADALDALATAMWYVGDYEETVARFRAAADVLRKPTADPPEDPSSRG